MRWNRLFWAATLSFMPVALFVIGGSLQTIQTASIVGGAPLLLIALLLCISLVKIAKHDLANHANTDQDTICLTEFSDNDPWD